MAFLNSIWINYRACVRCIIEATVGFGHAVCFWMPFITDCTTQLCASSLFFKWKSWHVSGRVFQKTINFTLGNFIWLQVWASPHVPLSLQMNLFWLRLALNQSLNSDTISGKYHLTLATGGNILCSHISLGVMYTVGCQGDLRAGKMNYFQLVSTVHSRSCESLRILFDLISDAECLMITPHWLPLHCCFCKAVLLDAEHWFSYICWVKLSGWKLDSCMR